ncbi:MAG: hypothetical protein Q8R01_04345 [Ramlibacter sp.]|nr:hypothetical protein [Ramlibacter sp.]
MPMLIVANRWSRVPRPCFPWVRTVERIICQEPLEALGGPEIQVHSDYSGDHKGSEYRTIALLYSDVVASTRWIYHRASWRRKHLPDGRRMSFKGLNDRKKQVALVPFLEAAHEISGLLLVVAINRSVTHPCQGELVRTAMATRFMARFAWGAAQFERMVQIAHLVALLGGGLGLHGQDLYWFSDEDELFANERAASDLTQVLGLFTGNYFQHRPGILGLGTTALDEGDRYEEDCAAVADLSAGAIARVLTCLRRDLGRLPASMAYEHAISCGMKTDVITDWFADESSRLRKVLVVFEPANQKQHCVFKMTM